MKKPGVQQDVSFAVLREIKEMGAAKSKSKMYYWRLSAAALRVLIVHANACATERNWSAWKRLCKAERAAMTLYHFIKRIMTAEYNGY